VSASEVPERIVAALSGLDARPQECADGIPTFEVERGRVRRALEQLHGPGGFEQSTLVTVVDRHPHEPRFEVVWQFRSYAHGDRVRLRCRVPGADAWVPSCCDLWPGASFSEREAWDMFGVRFEGHPDLRRLLMPEGYEHHPLRKDFPHQGIEPDRLYRQWDRERRERWLAEQAQEEAGA
jgi:NADH-quinone oxidoreductase subunit C